MSEDQEVDPTHVLYTWVTPASTTTRAKITLGEGTQREMWDLAANLMKYEMVDNLHMDRIAGTSPPADDIFAMWIQFAIAHAKSMGGIED